MEKIKPLHSTCVDVTSIDKQPRTEFVCGMDCPPRIYSCEHPQVGHLSTGGCKEPGCKCRRTNGFHEHSCGAWLQTKE